MINDKIFKELSKLNCIIPLSYAGHGKSELINIIGKHLNKSCASLSFSKTIKEIIVKSFSKEKIKEINSKTPEYNHEIVNDQDIYCYFEYLKNKRHDIKVFHDLNMREFMIFIMSDDFILSVDPNTKIKLACIKAINQLKKYKNTLFFADSTKYEDEFFFCLALNKSKNPLDFFKNYLFTNRKSDNLVTLQNRIMDIRLSLEKPLSNHDSETLFNLYYQLCHLFEEMLLIKGEVLNFDQLFKQERKDYFSSDQYQKMMKFGVFHIFKPLLPRSLDKENKNTSIRDRILNYTDMNQKELSEIINNYSYFCTSFKSESNLNNYGYLFANPHHISEKSLNLYKGVAIVNIPHMSVSEFVNQIYKIKNKVLNN